MKLYCVFLGVILVSLLVQGRSKNKKKEQSSSYNNTTIPPHNLDWKKAVTSTCFINIQTDFGNPQPLLIEPGTSNFKYPDDYHGIILFNENEQLELFCSNGFASPGAEANAIIVSCQRENKFTINNVNYSFKEFKCNSLPFHVARRTGVKCFAGKAIEVEIGFEVGDRFLKVFDVCHDEAVEQTIYTRYPLTPFHGSYQRSFPRSSFIQGTFFPGKNIDRLYTRVTQRQTIAKTLGSKQLSYEVVHERGDMFLARGHLAARVDFIYGAQQRSSFWFINCAPQWQQFNAVNWALIEEASRMLAADRRIFLDVYTGVFGVAELRDVNGNMQKIYLDIKTNQVPVPQIYYKILIEQLTSSGIVLIGVNNPHLTVDEIRKNHILCTDLSHRITFIKNWQRENITRGYSYACEVNEFIKLTQQIKGINVTNLLL